MSSDYNKRDLFWKIVETDNGVVRVLTDRNTPPADYNSGGIGIYDPKVGDFPPSEVRKSQPHPALDRRVQFNKPPGTDSSSLVRLDYKVDRNDTINEHLVLLIVYDEHLNGGKSRILVFDKGVTAINLLNQARIESDFGDQKGLHYPIAMFEPTDRGWELATKFCKSN
jgi:hypothetical protein